MGKSTQRRQSGLGIFGIFVIAIGLFIAFIRSDAIIAGTAVGIGVLFIVLSLFLERLDTIIDLLRQIVGRDKDNSDSSD